MDPEERKLLQKILKTVEKNGSILKKIHSSIKWGRFFKILYWAIIIGAAAGAFYFLQPFVEQVQSVDIGKFLKTNE